MEFKKKELFTFILPNNLMKAIIFIFGNTVLSDSLI